ncbi:hypothetical protein VMCG_02986 [Cytospora schulzeri]|uniref:Apple domain-containing protein n=1 Tax=Cytospora schulzeri TaxID=448051 RepID=A0A423WZH0_9PEZI|nr:hypothetical protein VMCG_02986 [Valsa malicola]
MQSTMMILTTLLAAGALASPFPPAGREQMCNKAPTAPHSGDFAPFSQPFGPTADLCHQHCQADQNCHSFVFGFPQSAQAPKCMLFRAPGWQVPGQEDDLHVFDRDCADVPTGRSSKQDPMGERHLGEEQGPHHEPEHNNQHGQNNQHDQNNQHGQDNHPGQSNQHDQNKAPPAAAPQAPSRPAPTHAAQPPQNGGHQHRDVPGPHKCGGAPSGPADHSGPPPAPMRTHDHVGSEQDCLTLCKRTDGCKAVEFGRPSPKAVQECRLFNVEAHMLPAPQHDQSFTAFDSRC